MLTPMHKKRSENSKNDGMTYEICFLRHKNDLLISLFAYNCYNNDFLPEQRILIMCLSRSFLYRELIHDESPKIAEHKITTPFVPSPASSSC